MAREPGAAIINLGGAVLDLGRGTLSRDGRNVPLRSKSFRLLCELARQPGRVVLKGELLDAVWPEVTVTEASLSQAVRDIRKAIADEAGQVLRTIARRGFMLCPPDGGAAFDRGTAATGSRPTQPRIALLPLADRTGAPDRRPILEGLVEEITAGLARFRNLTVVARHSAFSAAADKSLGLTEIGARLRADYIVDGSARLADGSLVLAVALNDVRSGEVLWGDSFTCDSGGWITLQDLIPRRIVQRLFAVVEEAGHRESLRRGTSEMSAFEHLARGRSLFRSFEPGVNDLARAHFASAIAVDPSLGVAHSLLGMTEMALHDYGLAPLEVKRGAKARAHHAVELSPDDSRCLSHLSYFHAQLREFEAAEQAARRAVELNPCDADALFNLGDILSWRGRAEDCLKWIEAAREVNPLWPAYYDVSASAALYDLERYEESARVLLRVPRLSARQEMRLAATYARMGDSDLTRHHTARARMLAPDLDFVEATRRGWTSEHERQIRHLTDGIELAERMAQNVEGGSITGGPEEERP